MNITSKHIPGSLLQFNNNNSKVCDIVIGFDFGTSCSKVVFQSPYHFDKKSFAVPIQINNNLTYLTPSQIYYSLETGQINLFEFKNAKKFSDLKIRVLENPHEIVARLSNNTILTPLRLTVSYIALILQQAREWYYSNKCDFYKNSKIIWHFNLGIPSGRFKYKNYNFYMILAKASWYLSTFKEINLINAEKAIGECCNKDFYPQIHPELVHIIPEVAAEVVCYANSQIRDNGLHLIIDIGARTLDIAGFELHDREGIDNYSLLKTEVRRLGTITCHESIIKCLKNHYRNFLNKELFTLDPLNNNHTKINSYLPESIKENEMEFYKQCYKVIHNVIFSLKNDRDPNSPVWEKGLPVFLCGGGQKIELYNIILDDLHVTWKSKMGTQGLKIMRFEKPEQFECDRIDFFRMAVAYGLSFPKDKIGEIWPTSKIKNIKKAENQDNYDSFFIRKEDV